MPALAGSSLQRSPESDPLATRITIDYRRAPVAAVLSDLAAIGGMGLDSAWKPSGLVTLALENVTLRTALIVFCESVGCQWTYDPAARRLTVSAVVTSSRRSFSGKKVSLQLLAIPAHEALRALGRTLNLRVVIDPSLPNEPVTLDIRDGEAASVLKILSGVIGCESEVRWDAGEIHCRQPAGRD
jgi:hypothetical protein